MKTLIMAAAAAACLVATPAMARDMGIYGTLGLSHADADIDVSFEAVTGRVNRLRRVVSHGVVSPGARGRAP